MFELERTYNTFLNCLLHHIVTMTFLSLWLCEALWSFLLAVKNGENDLWTWIRFMLNISYLKQLAAIWCIQRHYNLVNSEMCDSELGVLTGKVKYFGRWRLLTLLTASCGQYRWSTKEWTGILSAGHLNKFSLTISLSKVFHPICIWFCKFSFHWPLFIPAHVI